MDGITDRRFESLCSVEPKWFRRPSVLVILMLLCHPVWAGRNVNAIPEPTWVEVTACLLAVYALATEGKNDEAETALKNAAAFWVEPFDEVAQTALNQLRDDLDRDVRAATSSSVVALLEEISLLDDTNLRERLKSRIVSADPPLPAVLESIRLTHANSAFYDGDSETALTEYRILLELFPGSDSTGIYQFNIAVTLRDLERYNQAIPEFKRLFVLPVDNREAEGTTIMQMGYRNYHHRAAVNISWCYEKLEDWNSAQRWIRLAAADYPYEGCCGVDINSADRYIEKASDRIAFASGPRQGLARVSAVTRRAWPGWALLATWATLIVAGGRTSRLQQRRAIFASIPLALIASAVMAAIGLRDHWRAMDWVFPGQSSEVAGFITLILLSGSIVSLVLRAFKLRRIATGAFGLTCVAAGAFIILGLSGIGLLPPDLERLSLHDLQVAALSYYPLPLALLVSGAALLYGACRSLENEKVPGT